MVDLLETVIRLVGGRQYLAELNLLTGEIQAASSSFLEYDRAVIGTQFTVQAMGQALPTEQFVSFARQLSLATGTAETDLVNLQGYLARFGTDAPTIERASRVINDAAILTGKSVLEMAAGFEQARRGHGREFFRELGIPIRGVEGQLYDMNQILTIVEPHVHAFAQRMGKELPGETAKATAALKIMQDEVGRLTSPLAKWWADFKIGAGIGIAGLAHLAADALGIGRAGAQAGGGAAFTIGGTAARSRSEDYLRRIELNTGPQGALGRALRAGGSYAEPGAGMPIRDFQLALRHHR